VQRSVQEENLMRHVLVFRRLKQVAAVRYQPLPVPLTFCANYKRQKWIDQENTSRKSDQENTATQKKNQERENGTFNEISMRYHVQ
jgi:hypothetical protein